MSGAYGAARPTAPWALVLAWALVGLPLLWGISHTIQNALKLFQ